MDESLRHLAHMLRGLEQSTDQLLTQLDSFKLHLKTVQKQVDKRLHPEDYDD